MTRSEMEAQPYKAAVQIINSLGDNRGGLTKSIFDRLRLLSRHTPTYLLSFAYQTNIRVVFDRMVKNGVIPKDTHLINFYDDLELLDRINVAPIMFSHRSWRSNGEFQVTDSITSSGIARRFFRSGSFVGLKFYSSQNALKFIDVHDELRPWQRIYRDFVDVNGLVNRREFYDDEGKCRFRVYIDKKERPYLSTWVNSQGLEYRTVEHTPIGSRTHDGMQDAHLDWLNQKLQDIGPATVFSDSAASTFALKASGPDITQITSIHTTHRKNNIDSTDGLKYWVKEYTENIRNVSKIVFFTESQRQDFIKDTECDPEKLTVIYHAAPIVEGLAELEAAETQEKNHDRKKIVTISRLSPNKRIEKSLEAFALLTKDLHNVEYNIYGVGDSEDHLKKLAIDLNISEKVNFFGFADNPLNIFARSTISLMTSKFEGFGLTIIESLACGTPVIAFDVPYGPQEVIDGSNGVLVENDNISDLANTLKELLTDSARYEAMRERALETAEKFTLDEWETQWIATII